MKVLHKLLLKIVTLSGDISARCPPAKPIKVLHNSPLFKSKVKTRAFSYKCETKITLRASIWRKRRRKGWGITEMMNKLLNMINRQFYPVLAAL